jgi:CheY-like chemotaxis protein
MAMAVRLLLFEEFKFNICAFLAKVARANGFQTQEVSSVEACLEAVRTSRPDVVLMITNNISARCAFDLAEAIRSAHPKCGFVFLAGSVTEGQERYLAAGYVFHVREIPLPLPELMAAIGEAMNSPMGTFVIPEARQSLDGPGDSTD